MIYDVWKTALKKSEFWIHHSIFVVKQHFLFNSIANWIEFYAKILLNFLSLTYTDQTSAMVKHWNGDCNLTFDTEKLAGVETRDNMINIFITYLYKDKT